MFLDKKVAYIVKNVVWKEPFHINLTEIKKYLRKIFEKKIAEKDHSVFIKLKKTLGNGDLYYHY